MILNKLDNLKNMNKVFNLFISSSFLIFLVGCACQKNSCSKDEQQKNSEVMVGADVDSHGCKASAGYIWSEVKQDCIRLFEYGIAMKELNSADTTFASYIVFNSDSLKAEIFFSDGKNSGVLERRNLPLGGYAWNVEDDDTYNIRKLDGSWVIEKRGNLLFSEIR